MLATATATRTAPRHVPTVLRLLALIEMHGSQTAALEALLRQADELARLKAAVRGLGLSPELLASEPRATRA
jgi:hypothetical protein